MKSYMNSRKNHMISGVPNDFGGYQKVSWQRIHINEFIFEYMLTYVYQMILGYQKVSCQRIHISEFIFEYMLTYVNLYTNSRELIHVNSYKISYMKTSFYDIRIDT